MITVRKFEDRLGCTASPQRAAFCLALIALFLYNPFSTAPSSSADLTLQHPLSYRATVAGSELHCCTVDTANAYGIPLADLSSAVAELATTGTSPLTLKPNPPGRPARLLSNALAFRPPPTL